MDAIQVTVPTEISTIEDILQRLSMGSRQGPVLGKLKEGKLIIQMSLFDMKIDGTDRTNKLFTGAEISCVVKFHEEQKRTYLKSLILDSRYLYSCHDHDLHIIFCVT